MSSSPPASAIDLQGAHGFIVDGTLLALAPRYDLEEGLLRTIYWYRSCL